MNVQSENVHNVGMIMFDRPHILEVHALKKVGKFSTEKKDRLTKYPVSKVSGKNKIVHNVKRRLHGCSVTFRTIQQFLSVHYFICFIGGHLHA